MEPRNRRAYRWTGLTLLLSFLLVAFQPGGLEAQQSGPNGPADRPQHVVLLSIDGARTDLVQDFADEGVLPNMKRLIDDGVFAEGAIPVLPPVTAPSHASIITGASPSRTGIVSNAFRTVQRGSYRYAGGFSTVMEVETLWEAAERAEKRVAAVVWPGLDALAEAGRAPSWAVCFPGADSRSLSKHFSSRKWRECSDADWNLGEVSTHSPMRFQGVYVKLSEPDSGGRKKYDLNFCVIDRTDDGTENYDGLLIDLDRELSNGFFGPAGEGEWIQVTLPNPERQTFHVQVTRLSAGLSKVHAYVGRVYQNRTVPRELAGTLTEKLGVFPGSMDYFAFGESITEEGFWAQGERLAEWTGRVAEYMARTYEPDLLIVYHLPVDEIEHQYLLPGPGEAGYSEKEYEKGRELIRRAYQLADADLGRLLAVPGYGLDDAAYVLVSDHGMAPVHTTVNLPAVLKQAGLEVSGRETDAVVSSSGGSANVYLRVKGRVEDGSIEPGDVEAVLERVAKAFGELKDEEGNKVFELVLYGDSLGQHGLAHAHAGDLVAIANIGYVLNYRATLEEPLFSPPPYVAQHGYNPENPLMHGIFLAAGKGVNGPRKLGCVSLLDVAATVAELLGIEPPAGSEGHPVPLRQQ